jgi:hypothetical protein
MYKVIYHHYHKQNCCNVIYTQFNRQKYDSKCFTIKIIMFHSQIIFTVIQHTLLSVPVNLLSYQPINTITDKRVYELI